ncbi:MAG: DUF4056 domain-containing protein [Bacteroidales bacterium]|nr:DUF4056 domain-containing protein [Bacteroidales bacterium]
MKTYTLFTLLLFLLVPFRSMGLPPELSGRDLATPPPRVIRTCCSFGSDVRVMGLPFIKVTDITCINNLGKHCYLGSADEGNGIIYARRGGFIDLGHLRDQADWTAYLFALIKQNQKNGTIVYPLGHEGGEKTLTLKIPVDMQDTCAMLLAGRIAYDLSVWHEIATWYGASYIPLVPERYSSFSVEDAYSNLLGIYAGIEALKSPLPYEEAMTELINQKLSDLLAVSTYEETRMAMEEVHNIWWTREKNLPSGRVIIERQTNVYSPVEPHLVPGQALKNYQPYILEVPEYASAGVLLSDFYELSFKLNLKFPVKKIFTDDTGRLITQHHFDTLIKHAEAEWAFKEQKARTSHDENQHNTWKEKRARARN